MEDEDVGGQLPEFLRDPIGVVRRRRTWILATLGVGLVATLATVASLTPRYRAEAAVLVTSQLLREDIVRPTIREDTLQRINAMVGEILSRETLSDVIREHGLYPNLRETTPVASIATLAREDVKIEAEDGITGRRNQSAQIYRIQFEADDPETAAVVANDLANRFTDESIRSRSQQARLTTDFLRRELVRTESELRGQNKLITQFKQQHRGELPGELSSNLVRLDRLQQQRQSLGLQIAEAETRLALLTSGEAAPNTPEARLADARSRLAQELSVHTEDHPNVASLRRQVTALEAEIEQVGGGSLDSPSRLTLVKAARRQMRELRTQLATTETTLVELDAQVAATPARQEELSALEEKASVLREHYLDFLRKVQESELAQNLESAQQGARFSILDRAQPPLDPLQTRWKYAIAGLVGSLILAVMVAVLLEFMDPVLLSAAQVESLSGLPVLGTVPRIG